MFLVVSGCCRGAVGCCHGVVIVLLVVLLLVSVAGWHLEGWRLQLFGCFLRLSAGLAAVVHHFCGVFFRCFAALGGWLLHRLRLGTTHICGCCFWFHSGVFCGSCCWLFLLLQCLLALHSCAAFWLGILDSGVVRQEYSFELGSVWFSVCLYIPASSFFRRLLGV